MTHTRLLTHKTRLAQTRWHSTDDAPLENGQIRVRVEQCALTANNITYAAFGEVMNYWQFFPTGEADWGCVPVWGFGSVVQSLCPGVAVGERLWGYWPLGNSAVLTPRRLSEAGFADGAPHRRELHPVYNQYLRCNRDPFYQPDTEALQALLRPLFMTSWLIDDFLADNALFGAHTVLLSSASSKTAYGTAFALQQRPGLQVVGLTSSTNQGFCESLGCYHRVLAYEQLDQLAADTPCVYLDFSGNAALRRQVHSRFAQLTYSSSIGGTHVQQLGGAKDLPGVRPVLFFAPDQVKKRNADWGPAELGRRLLQSWQAFVARVQQGPQPWLQVQQHQGPQALQALYAQVLGGQTDPRLGHMLTLDR